MTDTEYYDLIRPYDDAMKLLLTRLEILNHNIYKASAENPIHTMQYRIKSKQSIEEKLIRKGEEPTLENAKDLLQDIAGIRIVCYFVGDIKNLIDMLKKQSDLIFIRERDYITNPKPNGYRSHHIILGVNVFCLDASEYYPVEIQLRTISMDFWAAMEHRISYKKEYDNRENLRNITKMPHFPEFISRSEFFHSRMFLMYVVCCISSVSITKKQTAKSNPKSLSVF